MSYPVIFFDIDGTLIDPSGCIHPQDVALLTSENPGFHLIPATGRSLDGLKRTFAQFGIHKGNVLPFPMVLENGAMIYDRDEVFLAKFPFEPRILEALIRLAEEFPHVCSFFIDGDDIHMLGSSSFGHEAAQKYHFNTRPFTAASRSLLFSKVMFLSPDHDTLLTIADAGKGLMLQGVFSMDTFFEFLPRGITKASGIKKLLSSLEMEDALVYAAGDAENDLEMLRLADVSFTPTTSSPLIQDETDHIIDVRREGLLRPILREAGLLH